MICGCVCLIRDEILFERKWRNDFVLGKLFGVYVLLLQLFISLLVGKFQRSSYFVHSLHRMLDDEDVIWCFCSGGSADVPVCWNASHSQMQKTKTATINANVLALAKTTTTTMSKCHYLSKCNWNCLQMTEHTCMEQSCFHVPSARNVILYSIIFSVLFFFFFLLLNNFEIVKHFWWSRTRT